MIFLCMVGFVENQKIDLVNAKEGVVQTLSENFGGTHNDHVICEMLLPFGFAPQVTTHIATEHIHRLIKVGFQDSMLLEDKCDGINLLVSIVGFTKGKGEKCTKKNEIRFGLPIARSSSSSPNM